MAIGKWDPAIQGERAYGEAGTSVPRERVWSEPPSRLEEDDGPGHGRRYESPRRILHTVPVVGARADVRPRVKNGDGKVTTAKARKYRPSEILTLFRRSAREPT